MQPGEGHFKIHLPKRFVYPLIAIGLILAILEAGQRVSDWYYSVAHARGGGFHLETSRGYAFDDASGPLILALDPVLVYRARPDQRAAGIAINSRGFRDLERPRAKPPGVTRVVILGGSSVFGVGMLDDERLFTRVLERRLRGLAREGREIEVWNAGTIGYNSTQELVLLTTEILDDSPDLVVVFDGWNDFWIAAHTPLDRDPQSPIFDKEEAAIVRSGHPVQDVLHLSAAYRSLERRLAALGGMLASSSGAGADYGAFHDHPLGLPLYRHNLERACRIVRAGGAPVLIVPQPEIFQRPDPIPAGERSLRASQPRGYEALSRAIYPRYVAAAREAAQAAGAAFLDGSRLFDGADEEVFVDFVHFNARGHELVAAGLLPAVARALGINPAAAP